MPPKKEGGAAQGQVQAVLFDRERFTRTKAKNWLRSHSIKAIKPVHETAHLLRYRVLEPSRFGRMRTKKIADGVAFVIGWP